MIMQWFVHRGRNRGCVRHRSRRYPDAATGSSTRQYSTVVPRSTRNRLLVATPPLEDPNFDRSVVYMLEHGDHGALGVVLNRPTAEHTISGLEEWCKLSADPAVVFSGGPVDPDALIGLAAFTSYPPEHSWSAVGNGIGTIDLSVLPGDLDVPVERLRLYRAYSGWGSGQLDAELAAGAWIVLDSRLEDVFCAEPEHLWRAVLRRQGGRLAWLADAPDDLSAN